MRTIPLTYPDVFAEREALEMLNGDVELLRSLMRLFLELAPLILGDVAVAHSRGDAEKLARLAYRLESSAAKICAYRLAATANELAAIARERGIAPAGPLVNRVTMDLGHLLGHLRSRLETLAPV